MIPKIEEVLQKVADTVEFGDAEEVGVNTRGIFQNTPMHVVISWRDLPALKVLIDNGADINAVGEAGFTPLHHAVMMRNADAVEELVNSGADQTLKTEGGDDAFSMARKIGDNVVLDRLVAGRKRAIN